MDGSKNDVDVSDVTPKIKCHIIEELIDDQKHVKSKKKRMFKNC